MSYSPEEQRLIQSGQSWNIALGVKGKLRFWHNREKYLDDLASLASGIYRRLHRQGVEINEAEKVKISPEERDRRAQKYISNMVRNLQDESGWIWAEEKLDNESWVIQKDKDYLTGLRLAWQAKKQNAGDN